MQRAKVDVLVCYFAYGGNGGVSSIIPELMLWNTRTIIKMKGDERIGRIQPEILSDTPITLTRNRAVKMAQEGGFDMILMLDSDNEPDGYLGVDPTATPFWETAFNFSYDRLIKGIPTVIAAPYCGPPPHPVGKKGIEDGGEVPYLFEWEDDESDTPHPRQKLNILKRNEAARLKGIYPVAALPTGVCLFTTSAFEGLKKPYFDYEWNEDHSEKHSTEDVFATRNISLYWKMTKNIDVLFATCDSWALHHKPKRVGKPRVTPVEVMSESFRAALADPVSAYEAKKFVDFTADLPHRNQMLTDDQNQVYISDEELDRFAAEEKAESATVGVLVDPRQDEGPDDDGYSDPEKKSAEEHIKANGHKRAPCLAHKMVNGRKIALVDFVVTDPELDAISSLASWCAERAGGPVRAAVLHSGTGLSTAAIEAVLPQGSHVFCLDNLIVQPNGSLKAEQFVEAFRGELENGRIKAEIEERFVQSPLQSQELDLVFIESGLTPELVADWLRHVKDGGVIAGLGVTGNEWLFDTVLNIKTHGGTSLWAAPVGIEVASDS